LERFLVLVVEKDPETLNNIDSVTRITTSWSPSAARSSYRAYVLSLRRFDRCSAAKRSTTSNSKLIETPVFEDALAQKGLLLPNNKAQWKTTDAMEGGQVASNQQIQVPNLLHLCLTLSFPRSLALLMVSDCSSPIFQQTSDL
jgi:hypothetical protein